MDALLRRRVMIAAGGGEPPTPPQPQPILPAGYTELSYVYTNSNAYIDTGIAGATDLEITTKFYAGSYVQYGAIYGNYIDDSYNLNRAVLGSQTSLLVGGGLNQSQSVSNFSLGAVHTLVVNSTTAILDGVSTSITAAAKTANTRNICLGNRAAANPVERNIGLSIYSFEIKKGGTTVLNLVPAMRDSDDAVGFYDLVSDSFMKSLTGTEFVAGPEVNNYTPVEYIETDGTAYIDTGISGSIPRSFEMRITPMPVSSGYYYFAGVRESASSRLLPLVIASDKTAGFAFNGNAYSPTSIATSIDNRSPMDVRTHIRSGSQQIGIKQAGESSYTNYSKTATDSFTTTLKIFLFTGNDNGNIFTSCAGVRLHSVRIYLDSTYTTAYFDGQPCIYNGEYGLWNRVSGTFFGNAAASGAFTGPSAKVYDWSNLTWLLVGDSLTELNYRAKTHYFNYVNDLTGINFVNKGSSGKGYANGDYFYSVFNNLSGINFSFATIFGSGNDIRYEAISSLSSAANWTAALGDINDNGTSTICGYINRALDKFAAVAPSKKIGIVTPTPWKNGSAGNVSLTDEETNTRLRTYSEKLVLIAQARGIPYLDLFNNSGLDPWDEDFRIAYYNEDGVQDPGVHPNSEGHRVFLANPFLSFLAQNLV